LYVDELNDDDADVSVCGGHAAFTQPPYSLSSMQRTSYQWPTFNDGLLDDVLKGRYDYTPNTQPAIGISQYDYSSTRLILLKFVLVCVRSTLN